MRTRSLLFTVTVGATLAWMLFPPAGVDVVTGATSGKKKSKTSKEYVYLVVRPDGKFEVKPMTPAAAKKLRRDLLKGFTSPKREWLRLKKAWAEDANAGACPVPPPKTPKCQELEPAPSNSNERTRTQKKYDRMLSRWSICMATDHTGKQQTLILRRDEIFGARRGLLESYAKAVMAARGDDEAAAKIKKPAFKTLRSRLRSKEIAKKVVAKLEAAAAAKDNG